MILVSNEDYKEMQQKVIKDYFSDFLKNLETHELPITEDMYNLPRAFIYELLKYAFVGFQEYINVFIYLGKIMCDNDKLKFFGEPHTKEEVRAYVKNFTK